MLLENQNAKPSFISFGGLTLKMIYPLLMGASHILISISYELFDTDKVGNFNQYEYFLLLIMFFSESLIFIVYLIHLYLSKSKSQSRRSILKPKQMKTQAKIKIILKIVLLLFICSTLDLIRNIFKSPYAFSGTAIILAYFLEALTEYNTGLSMSSMQVLFLLGSILGIMKKDNIL